MRPYNCARSTANLESVGSYVNVAVVRELQSFRGTQPGAQDIQMNRCAFALAGLVKAGANEASLKAAFIDAVLSLPCAGVRWTRKDAELKWRRAMRDAAPRPIPDRLKQGGGFVYPAANHVDKAQQEEANERAAAEYEARKAADDARKRRKAQQIYSQIEPARGSPAEWYFNWRGVPSEAIPSTAGFISDARRYPELGFQEEQSPVPCAVHPFGFPLESEPGVLFMPVSNVMGLHIMHLLPDGRGKARQKKTFGPSSGFPIVLSPPGDSLGMLIAEGIEDALSAHGYGFELWAAGTADRLPKLAAAVPDVIEVVSVCIDDDEAGRRGSEKLKNFLLQRDFEVRFIRPWRSA